VLLFVLGARARGVPFQWAPDEAVPAWRGGAPYQRDLEWTFTRPPDIAGPTYRGSLDELLRPGDSVILTGDVTWHGGVAGISPVGLIGIFNNGVSAQRRGTAVFRIANPDRP
jgi:hypothetical protein